MDYLWSPWRMNYIQNHSQEVSECVFCKLLLEEDGPYNLIVNRGKTVFVILNRFPYTSGHLMVVPYAHQATFENLETDVLTELMQAVTHSMKILGEVYHPQAFNLGVNIGAAAGAGIADHVHMHVVPRWTGDTNFMSTLGQIRVLPEELEETYRRITAAWKAAYRQVE